MDDDQFSEKEARNGATRSRLSPEVTEILKSYFVISSKPTLEEREDLANRTGLTPRVIQIWFQNRRSKLRKEASDTNLFRKTPAEGVGRSGIESAITNPLPTVTAKNFKEMCLPQYLDPPFAIDHHESHQKRRKDEAIKNFWREQAIANGLINEDQQQQNSAKKRRTSSSYTTSASYSSTNSMQPTPTQSTAELFQAIGTPVEDMPNLSRITSPSLTSNYIPFQHIQPQLFHDSRTKRAYIPQLDSLTNNLDFLFTLPSNSQSHNHPSISSQEPFNPISNNLNSIDFFSLFPEVQEGQHQF